MKYIQSFYRYQVTFSSIGRTIPSSLAEGELRNIAEISEAELDKLQNREPFFRELVEFKKYRVLNHLPEGYKSSARRLNEANEEIARLKAENEKLKGEQPAEEAAAEQPAEEAAAEQPAEEAAAEQPAEEAAAEQPVEEAAAEQPAEEAAAEQPAEEKKKKK